MIEPKELLAPTATLFAVIIALFAFMFPRALTLYRERLSAVSQIDVPDRVRKRFRFKIGALGDVLLLFVTSSWLLGLGTIYCPALLYRIANFYLGSTHFSSGQILSDFGNFVRWLGILTALALVAVVTLVVNDVFVSENLPVKELGRPKAKNCCLRRRDYLKSGLMEKQY
jgi:hypothetical protein